MGFTKIEKSGGAIRVIESDLEGNETSYIVPSGTSHIGRNASIKYTAAKESNAIRNVWDNQSRATQEGFTFADIQNQPAKFAPVGMQAPDTSQWNMWEATGLGDQPMSGGGLQGFKDAWKDTFGGGNGDPPPTNGNGNGNGGPPPADPPPETGLPTQGTGVLPTSGTPVNQGGAQVSYAQTPWAYIYGDFINQTVGLGGNPAIYQHMRSEGLSNDPLKRTIFTQFLLDGTYGDTNRQALYGIQPGTDLSVDHIEQYGIGEGNPYADYLKSYRAFTPGRTVGLIFDVISALKTDAQFEIGKADEYTPAQIREFRWEERFGAGPNALQNQQALAAMPIMRATPALLQDETSRILNMLYQRWQADPDKDDNMGWLEHVYRNKFFGLAGDISQEWGGIVWSKGSAAEVGERPAGAGPYDYAPAPEKTEVVEKVPDDQSTNPVTKAKIVIPEPERVIPEAGPPNTQALPGQEGYSLPTIKEKIALHTEFGTPWADFGGVPIKPHLLKYQTSKEQEAAFQRSRQFMEFSDKGSTWEDSGRTRITGKIDRFEDWVNE